MKNRLLPKLTTQQQALFWLQMKYTDKLSYWEWQGCTDKDGYGKFKSILAHRLAYYL